MIDTTQAAIRAHAVSAYPRECCGVVIVVNGKERYWPCKNIAETPAQHFAIDPSDYAQAEDLGEVVAIVHSHPDELPVPSEADKVMCEATGLPWHIVHVSVPGTMPHHPPADDTPTAPVPEATTITTFEPTGYQAPLVGRPFVHGILDCYTLVRDFYSREMLIDLPDFAREDEWWDKGENLYMDNFEAAGCAPIKGLIRVGDIILMTIRSPVPNHAAVYIGDGLILHHVANRLSSRDVYDGYWQENTRMIVRHGDVK